MSRISTNYENFLELRRQEHSNFLWASRQLNPQLAYKQVYPRPTPLFHKESVLNSPKIQKLLERISNKQNVSKLELENQVKAILDEIGYNKNLKLTRWLGLVLTKICLRIFTGIYVNTNSLIQVKKEMGNCPILFVPSHRSYADFILMDYLCFTYDIEIPAVAAGMDFHGMWGIGTMLRDTGAFFMRRSYNDDSLYWEAFKQYIYQLVTKGDLPIEFFIEGTRSRSNKSLVPKYGLISMVLKAFFFSEVPDIKFVPINISYDRILEETLFAFELVGVPKPKESTSGFFKSLSIIKENFGEIFLHVGEPISAKTFFQGKFDKIVHNMAPLHLQEITEQEKALIPSLAHEIVYNQQKCGIITVFSLLSLILNHNLVMRKLVTSTELVKEVEWLKDIIQKLGAVVYAQDTTKSIDECFVVHKNLIELREGIVCLVQNNIELDKIKPSKFKAHCLSEKCLTFSIPFVMLQIYINPTLQYFIDVGIIVIILKADKDLTTEALFNTYNFFRSLFSVEFVISLPRVKTEFQNALQYSIALNLIKSTPADSYQLGGNTKLQDFLSTMLQPFIMSYFTTIRVIEKSPIIIDEKTILVNTQKMLENKINNEYEFVHPYCLNLDTLSNCLNVLSTMGVIKKTKRDNTTAYEIRRNEILQIKEKLGTYLLEGHSENKLSSQVYLQNKL